MEAPEFLIAGSTISLYFLRYFSVYFLSKTLLANRIAEGTTDYPELHVLVDRLLWGGYSPRAVREGRRRPTNQTRAAASPWKLASKMDAGRQVAAGAGFSADSGLPVYQDVARDAVYLKMGVDYQELANERWFSEDPEIAIGFWGHSFNLYKDTEPHAGYAAIRDWIGFMFRKKAFVYTSNVDGHFAKSGFNEEQVYEIHGSIDQWQCSAKCCQARHNAPTRFRFTIDEKNKRAFAKEEPQSPSGKVFVQNHPECPKCSRILRPNIMLFGDKSYIHDSEGERRYVDWEEAMESSMSNSIDSNLKTHDFDQLVILELGCGVKVPTVRMEVEMVARDTISRMSEGVEKKARKAWLLPRVQVLRVNLQHAEEKDTEQTGFYGDAVSHNAKLVGKGAIVGLRSKCEPFVLTVDRLLKRLRGTKLLCLLFNPNYLDENRGPTQNCQNKDAFAKRLIPFLDSPEVGNIWTHSYRRKRGEVIMDDRFENII
eukprot:jgi/Bigna1/74504/fgenesh1_pg.29_\